MRGGAVNSLARVGRHLRIILIRDAAGERKEKGRGKMAMGPGKGNVAQAGSNPAFLTMLESPAEKSG